ncbi:MAG: hypothetical protein ACFFDF_23750 [Candidatus Odinarchaeota archaeon]
MRKINDIAERLFNFIPGYIFGLFAFMFGLIFIIIALLLTPEYIMWKLSVSMLGILTGGIFLRIGLIVSNILSLFFIISLGKAVKNQNLHENMRKLAISSGIFSSISVIFTGVFTGSNPLISDLHGLFALLSWIGGAITCLTFGFLMLKNSHFSNFIAFNSLIVGGIFGAYLIPFMITIICSFACYPFGFMVYQIMPVWEWVLMFSILLWYLVNSIFLRIIRFNNLNGD